MQEYITPNSIANEIRMQRSVSLDSFLIVEGDTDARVYRNFVINECQIKIAFNKVKAVEVIEILNADNFVGAVAIVDADFDFLENIETPTQNLFLTDFHDLECIIFASPALEKVLFEFGSEGKIKKLNKQVRDFIFELGIKVGSLRLISISEKLNLKFEDLDFSKFIAKDTLSIDISEFVRRVMINSRNSVLNQNEVIKKIKAQEINSDKHQVCCGKDLVEILSIGLQKVLGTNNSNKVTSEIIARDLRLAFEFEFFVSTNLYRNVKDWEKQNIPFKIFR